MSTALVTGGAGFIGSHLAERLLVDGWSVRVLDDLSTGSAEQVPAGAELEVGSITDLEIVHRMAKGADVIFHLAAIASVQRSMDDPQGTALVNLEGTRNVVVASMKVGARVIYSSSSAVYGDAGANSVDEESPTAPISPYGFQKLESERLVVEAGGVALRYFNVFGPRQSPSSDYSGVVSIFGKRAWKGEELVIFGDGSATRDFVPVRDVIDANVLAIGKTGVFCIGSGRSRTVLELATTIQELTGAGSTIRFAPARTGDILHSSCSISRAERELGFAPQGAFTRDLADTLAWLR